MGTGMRTTDTGMLETSRMQRGAEGRGREIIIQNNVITGIVDCVRPAIRVFSSKGINTSGSGGQTRIYVAWRECAVLYSPVPKVFVYTTKIYTVYSRLPKSWLHPWVASIRSGLTWLCLLRFCYLS